MTRRADASPLSGTQTKDADIPCYEVIDADAVDDAFPNVWCIAARPSDATHTGDRWAMDVEDAAEQWADENFAYYDYPDEMRASVRSPLGERHLVVVTVETVPSFHGRVEEP